jgi:hypothetical protein
MSKGMPISPEKPASSSLNARPARQFLNMIDMETVSM